MQYTRPMIDLVYEIRRRVDSALKPSVKLANPEMFQELADYYQHSRDTITKTLIKELLSQAGDDWLALLDPPKAIAAHLPKQLVKVYRGQTLLEEAPQPPASQGLAQPAQELRSELITPPPAPAHKSQRMYRGHPVD